MSSSELSVQGQGQGASLSAARANTQPSSNSTSRQRSPIPSRASSASTRRPAPSSPALAASSTSAVGESAALAALAAVDRRVASEHMTEETRYELHPRLAYSSRELTRHSLLFLNDRTILFSIGLHLFKFDVGTGQLIAAAANGANGGTGGMGGASSDGKAPSSSIGGLVAPPLPGMQQVAPEPGVADAAVGCMEYFFKRSYSVPPIIAISRNRSKLVICEDMERTPGAAAAHAAAAAHPRSSLHSGGHAGTLNGVYKKALISVIDLAADPPSLCWQFHHHHSGRICSVDFSANGNLLAVCVELDQADSVGRSRTSNAAATAAALAMAKKKGAGAATTSGAKSNQATSRSRRNSGGISGLIDHTQSEMHEEEKRQDNAFKDRGWHEETDDVDRSSGMDGDSGNGATSTTSFHALSAVTLYRVDTHKFLATHSSDHLVRCVAVNPDDSNLSVVSGSKYIRYIKTIGAQLDEVPFLKRLLERTYVFTHHAWISGSTLAALTEESEIIIFVKGSLRQVIAPTLNPPTDKLISMVIYRDGFLLGSQEGTLMQVVPSKQAAAAAAAAAANGTSANADGATSTTDAAGTNTSGAGGATGGEGGSGPGIAAAQQPKLFKVVNELPTHKGALTSLIISPNEGLLLACVREHGLCAFPLDPTGKWGDNGGGGAGAGLGVSGPGTVIGTGGPDLTDLYLPSGDVLAISTCGARSLVATASSDHTVSIWSHFRASPKASPCAIRHTFHELPVALAFHPNGYQILIGFGTHIALFHILRHSIKLSYSFQLYTRTVTPLHIKYSHAGHKVAIATGVHVFIYRALDFALLQHLAGNNGLIHGLEWSSTDDVVATCNGEGAIIAWELSSGNKIYNHVDRGVEFHTMVLDWGRRWEEAVYQQLHLGATGANGVLPGAGADPSARNTSGEGGANAHANLDNPLDDHMQVLASGATFTSYKLRSLSASGAQEVRARDLTITTPSAQTAAPSSSGGAPSFLSGGSSSSLMQQLPGEELPLDRISITHLIRDPLHKLLIAATSTGYILLFRWPFKKLERDLIETGLNMGGGGGGVGIGLGGASSSHLSNPYDALHGQVLGKFLVHDGPLLHLALLPPGVLISYGNDGNMFVLDLRIVDMKALTSAANASSSSSSNSANAARSGGKDKTMSRSKDGFLIPSRSSSSSKSSSLTPAQLLSLHHKSYRPQVGLRSLLLPKAISNAPQEWAKHLYTTDADLVLLRNTEYESILSEIRENSADVARMERTAEYQLSGQKDFYMQKLKTLRTEMEGLLAQRETELAHTKHLLKQSETDKQNLQQQHRQEVMELNNSWRTTLEKKLHESYVSQEKKKQEITEVEKRHEQEMEELRTQHAREFEMHQSESNELANSLRTRIAELELALKESEASYEEAMAQMESEHDTQVVSLQRSSHAARIATREGTAILCAEVSAAKRKLQERSDACKQLEVAGLEKEDQLQHLATVIRRLTQELTSLKAALRDKEEQITRRQHELAQARQDNGTLKNFLEILEHRIAELENRETPALITMLELKKQVESMSDELYELNKAKLSAQALAEQKQGEATRFSNTANALRHKLAKKEHAWEGVQKEIKYLMEHSGKGTTQLQASTVPSSTTTVTAGPTLSTTSGALNLAVELKALYANYFHRTGAGSGGGGKNGSGNEPEQADRSLIEKVEIEATRQRNFLEKSLHRLRHANAALAARTKADGEKALAQNINSLHEVNRLREENQRLYQRCGLYRSMVVQAGLGRKLDLIDTGDEGAALREIEEERAQDDAVAAAARRKRLGLPEPNSHRSRGGDDTNRSDASSQRASLPRPSSGSSYPPLMPASTGKDKSVSSRPLQSSGDNMPSATPLFGLASQSGAASNVPQHLGQSQSAQSLPAVSNDSGEMESKTALSSTGVARSLRVSESSPALLPHVQTSPPSSSSPSGPSISSPSVLKGKDGLTIESAESRASREEDVVTSKSRKGGRKDSAHQPRRDRHRRGASISPARDRPPSPVKGSTRLHAENTNLLARAQQLEQRLEKATQGLALQQVHISALQSALKAKEKERQEQTVQMQEETKERTLMAAAVHQHSSTTDLGSSDVEEEVSMFSGPAPLPGSSPSHFFRDSPPPVPRSAGRPPSSRGRLSPLRGSRKDLSTPPPPASASSTSIAASVSTRPLISAGTAKKTRE